MSQNAELGRFKLLLGIFVLFCLSAFKSCQEVKYRTGGKACKTTVSNITESTGRRGRHVGYKIWYAFKNENTGKTVNGYTETGLDGADRYHKGQELTIEYIGTEIFSSRIQGSGSLFWPTFFVLSVVAMIGSIVVFWRHVSEKTAKMKRG